jgi:group I intron endonuclease
MEKDQCLAMSSISSFKPLATYSVLSDTKLLKKDLSKVGGVYAIVNTESGYQYIGSSLDLHNRLMDHIKGRDSNKILQRAINKYGLGKFKIVIYFYYTDTTLSLTDIETSVIASFDFSLLYNFKKDATSMLGYKHTEEAKEKMRSRFLDKTNHPMFGSDGRSLVKHDESTLSLINNQAGIPELNPMFMN